MRGNSAEEQDSRSLAVPGWFDFQLLYTTVDVFLCFTENWFAC